MTFHSWYFAIVDDGVEGFVVAVTPDVVVFVLVAAGFALHTVATVAYFTPEEFSINSCWPIATFFYRIFTLTSMLNQFSWCSITCCNSSFCCGNVIQDWLMSRMITLFRRHVLD